MKITRTRLKRIIKEELQNVLNTRQRVNEAFPDPFGLTDEDPQADLDRAEDEARELDRENNPQDAFGNIPSAQPPVPAPTPPPAPTRDLGPVFYRKLLNVMGPQDLKGYGRNSKGRGHLSYGQWIAGRRALARGGYEALTNWMRGQAPGLSRTFLDTQNELQGGEARGPEHDYIGNLETA